MTGPGGVEPGAEVASLETILELYSSLGLGGRFGIHAAATLLVATVVLGLLPNLGFRTVAKGRRSPVISLCVGVPMAAVLVVVTATGYLIAGTSFGVFFGIPMVAVGLLALPTLTALGFAAVGRSIASRAGTDRLWVGVLLGALVSGVLGLAPVAAVSIGGVIGALGIGAGTRILLGFRGSTDPRERTVPPANRV